MTDNSSITLGRVATRESRPVRMGAASLTPAVHNAKRLVKFRLRFN